LRGQRALHSDSLLRSLGFLVVRRHKMNGTKLTNTLALIVIMSLVTLGMLRTAVTAFRPHQQVLKRFRNSRSTQIAMSTMDPVRVRFAPSPTGTLHVGGARTALFNWLLAKKTGGKFIIRVEDTDQARSTRESEDSILNDLKWMNMNWDEGPGVDGPHGPYRQSERKDIYGKIANQLIEQGHAYRCFCTEEELEQKRLAAEEAGIDAKYDNTWRDADPALVQKKLDEGASYTVRFKIPKGKVISIDDRVRGRVTWDAEAALGDFIILRSNGMPVYNFCVSVDDADMKITHVVRAEEHLSNTLRQMLIFEALGFEPPVYAHCSLILGQDRAKLSKRHGATSVKQFSEQGFIPDAMMNYLANLGWNDGTDKEIYTPTELVDSFEISRIVKTSAMFDMDKLKWVNAQHLRLMTLEDVQPLVQEALTAPSSSSAAEEPAILTADSASAANFNKFMPLAAQLAQRDMELTTESPMFVGNCLKFDLVSTLASDASAAEVLQSEAVPALIETLVSDYDSGTMPRADSEEFAKEWKAYMKALGKQLGLKGKGLFQPVRLCLTGRMSGPDVGEQLKLITFSEGVVNSEFPTVSVEKRIEFLRTFSVADMKKSVDENVSQ